MIILQIYLEHYRKFPKQRNFKFDFYFEVFITSIVSFDFFLRIIVILFHLKNFKFLYRNNL
jgi:hypothetical protein